jgi:FixJ family two-component response regulator
MPELGRRTEIAAQLDIAVRTVKNLRAQSGGQSSVLNTGADAATLSRAISSEGAARKN